MLKKTFVCIWFLILVLMLNINVFADEEYSLEAELNKTKFELTENITGSGRLNRGESGVSGSTISFRVEDKKGKSVFTLGQYETNGNGEFQIGFKVPSSIEAGEYIVIFKYFNDKASTELEKKVELTLYKPSSQDTGGGGGSSSGEDDETITEATISSTGGTITDSEENIEINFEEGTFNKEVNVAIELVSDDKIIDPRGSDSIERISEVYEFTSTISEFKKPVNVKFKYDNSKLDDKNVELLGVYVLNEETNTWEYVGGKVDKKNNQIIVGLKHFSKYTVMLSTKTFGDISNHWAKHQIEVMAAKHIINGKDDMNFVPEDKITRAEFAKIIVNAIGLEKKNYEGTFADVSENIWYTEYVEAAAKAGIVKGSDGQFSPNKEITRQEMAVMIVRALKLIDSSKTIQAELAFDDTGDIASWAKEAVAIAYNNEIIKGKTPTAFEPLENAKRAESAQMIYNLLKVLDKI